MSILGQFCTYLKFRGEKYLNTFIVTNVNDCPNLLSYGAKFRMEVLLPDYPEENVVKSTSHGMQNGISHVTTGNGTANGTLDGMSNMFQILNDLWKG